MRHGAMYWGLVASVILAWAGTAAGDDVSFEILPLIDGIPGGGQSVMDISADGQFATGVGSGTVFRWERGVGATAISPTNWEHTFTAGISADGSTIGGQMINWNTYETRGWIATIPAPGASCFFLGGIAALSARRRR